MRASSGKDSSIVDAFREPRPDLTSSGEVFFKSLDGAVLAECRRAEISGDAERLQQTARPAPRRKKREWRTFWIILDTLCAGIMPASARCRRPPGNKAGLGTSFRQTARRVGVEIRGCARDATFPSTSPSGPRTVDGRPSRALDSADQSRAIQRRIRSWLPPSIGQAADARLWVASLEGHREAPFRDGTGKSFRKSIGGAPMANPIATTMVIVLLPLRQCPT